jgi:hypothetical protein
MHKEVTNFIYAGAKPERSQWLDVIRGLAIFGVVSTHSIQLTDNLVLTNSSNFFLGSPVLVSTVLSYSSFYQGGY